MTDQDMNFQEFAEFLDEKLLETINAIRNERTSVSVGRGQVLATVFEDLQKIRGFWYLYGVLGADND